jgi:hypothetical protein
MAAREYNAAEVNRLLRFGLAHYSSKNMANLIASTQPHETHAASPPPQLEPLTPAADEAADEAPADGDLLPEISFAAVLTNGQSYK